ncbi:MAG: hypothetical protein H3C43_07765 [Leptonema sp. (in: Bacteria)]|nr:hypothetical protein [Leptonema sp. (in: bacteria)]
MNISFRRLFIPILFFIVGSVSGRESVDEVENLATEPIALQPIAKFKITNSDSKLIRGDSTEKGSVSSCNGKVSADQTLANFTAISTFYQNSCYTDGRYNHRDFLFTAGQLQGSEGDSYQTITIDPPKKKAVKFLASHHVLAYQFQKPVAHYIYQYDRGNLSLVAEVASSDIKIGEWHKLQSIDLSQLGQAVTYVVVPQNPLSIYHTLNDRTIGAKITDTKWGGFEKRIIKVSGKPFDTLLDYTAGPADHENLYGVHRQFFFLEKSDKSALIVYQDKTTGNIQFVELDHQLKAINEKTVVKTKEVLAATAIDDQSQVYLLQISQGNNATFKLQKLSADGRVMANKTYNTGPSELNIYKYADNLIKSNNISAMSVNQGKVAVIVSRTMNKSADGLNHQGAIAVVFDANSLNLIKNLGQTSGHSFGNFLINDGNGFVAIDLGDNYPRGVHLHRLDENRKASRVVFTFKTEHGNTPKSPAGVSYPLYTEISSSSKKYYQWSNDNRTYTEIAGLAKALNGYIVAFATEFPQLRNDRASSLGGSKLNDPRNLAAVYVTHDFQNVKQSGNYVVDDLMIWRGNVAESKFYDFGGRANNQRNVGAVQLTNYTSTDKNVSRPKFVSIGENRNFVIYEEWSATSYRTTWAVEFNNSGKVVKTQEFGPTWRLNRQDDLYFVNGRLISISGSGANKTIEINSILIE